MRVYKEWVKEQVAKHCVVRVGSNRVVLDFIRLGFVIKLPIVHLAALSREIRMLFCESRVCPELFHAFIRLCAAPVDLTEVGGVGPWLFKGIADNWREFWFSAIERHPFAYPTYFSLFGLVNIQKKGTPVDMGREMFSRKVKGLIGEQMFYFDGHHLSVPANFSFFEGRLRIMDYGSPKTRKVIREVGMCLYNNFQCDDAG